MILTIERRTDSKMIVLKDIIKTYKNSFTFTCNDLIIKENSLYCIKGKNGSGKSTLLKMLSGHINFDKGSLMVDDKPFSENRCLFCGFLGSDRIMDFLTAKEYLYLVGKSYGLNKHEIENNYGKINEYFNKTYFDDTKFIHQYSDGNKQLIGIYASFISFSKYIYLDELFNYLEKDIAEKLIAFLNDYIKINCNTVIVCDNTEMLESVAGIFYINIINGNVDSVGIGS